MYADYSNLKLSASSQEALELKAYNKLGGTPACFTNSVSVCGFAQPKIFIWEELALLFPPYLASSLS